VGLIPDELAAILVCPVDHADLDQDPDGPALVCQVCRRRFPVRDGIPVMLVEEAELPEGE
jgi:uncharacterized protein YbaR (Trm112 family)